MLPKVRRFFKSNRTPSGSQLEEVPNSKTLTRPNIGLLSPIIESDNTVMDKRSITFNSLQKITGHHFIDDVNEEVPIKNDSRPAPHWFDGPRDSTTLPDIIASTYSDYGEEADYAMKQMLAILESLNPIETYLTLFEDALKAIEFRLPFDIIFDDEKKPDWKAMRQKQVNHVPTPGEDVNSRGMSSSQMSAVFDAIPFLFDAVTCNEELHHYHSVLSMIVMIAMTGGSAIRRQSINAITALMERSMLSQSFMRQVVVPGLFHIYQSGVGTFQSNDLRMECVQALCQVISYDTIHDRQWLFENFLPRFSQMLKDPTMHVRKSALHIFGNLGNMFGQKFTEVFLVPHLITLSCDMTWAVRKVACEIFVKVAECASKPVRVDILSPNFIRLLNDPNKWVSFIAYQQLGPFIALFANPDITGLELKNGQIIVNEIPRTPNEAESSDTLNATFSADTETDEFKVLPPNTWLPEVDYNDDFEYQLALMNETAPPRFRSENVSSIVKTPKRGERVMDSVLSGINKMFSKTSGSKEVEKIAATFSSPSKRSPLSLHSAVSLMDKWSKRSNPNNPQRFPVFDSNSDNAALSNRSSDGKLESGGTGIAAKCSSTDDLTKLGLEDDTSSASATNSSPHKRTLSPETKTASPRGRRIATNAWSKLNIGQKLFLRRLGALPPSSTKRQSKLLSPTRSPNRATRKKVEAIFFDFAAPTEVLSADQNTPPPLAVDELNTVERERYMEKAGPKFNAIDTSFLGDSSSDSEDDDEASFDKSFVADEEEAPLRMEIKSPVSETVSVSTHRIKDEPISNEFSLTYWSSNYAISSIDDELKPFGSSSAYTNSPTSNNYLESRYDVMKVNNLSPRTRSSSFGSNESPPSTSPRRKANSVSESHHSTVSSDSAESVVMLNTEEKEKLGILDIDEMEMSLSSNSSIHGEAAMTEESDISLTPVEKSAFQHVPSDLVESYMKVMGPISHANSSSGNGESLYAEIYRHCAYNFPAVCYTLGRAAWPRLKLVFRKLALDEQAKVRQSISYSIHEIAQMLGPEITDDDLLPIFYDLRNDQNSDVRNGILLHLYDFVKCLSEKKREEMIFSLPQFFPIGAQPGNQIQNGDWRSRFELISQLSKLCTLYSIQDVNFHMSGIALTLADDRVAEVRREAVTFVSTIVGALVSAEWEEIKKNRDIEHGNVDIKTRKEKSARFLSEQFVDDIASSFAKTQKWTRRQTFCFICAQILRDKQCDGIQFRYFFASSLQSLVEDKVPNVRLASCEALSVWRKMLLLARTQERRGQSPLASPVSEASSIRRDINLVSNMMVRLSNDSDIDAAYLAKKCQGLTDEQQPVDVEARTNRMREREEQFFGDLILTDSDGSVVRVVGKEIKQFIKQGVKLELDRPDKIAEKMAPIETIDDEELNDDDFMEMLQREVDAMSITTPPEICASVQTYTVDNTELVDREIDEIEEPIKKEDESECDIPMDPTPSATEIHQDQLEVTSQGESNA